MRILTIISLLSSTLCLGQEVEVCFGNLHAHTSYSDGKGTPKEAFKHARDVADLDFMAVTEHNHMVSSEDYAQLMLDAHNINREGSKFIALYGQEYSTIKSGNHANVFEVNEIIPETHNGDWNKLLKDWYKDRMDSEGEKPLILLSYQAQIVHISPSFL